MNILKFMSSGGSQKINLRRELSAAAVVTAIAIPESLAFAGIVGLPLRTGLYCALLAPLVFALLTSSRHLIVGADSATAALVASGAATVATAGATDYMNAVAALGIVTGLVLIFMSVARFGFLADLISRPVFVGFLSGIGLQLILSKTPDLLGIEFTGSGGHPLQKFAYALSHLDQTNLATMYFSLALFALIIVCNKRKLPGSLIGIITAIIVVYFGHIDSSGVKLVEPVAAGLPHLFLPNISLSMLSSLLMPALAISLVILAQSSSVIRNSAARFDEPVDDNRDLNALGFANIASALTGGFAVNGSPPRTIAAEMNGGRTQLVNVLMAIFIALLLAFFSQILSYVPIAVLAVIIFLVGLHLFDIPQLRSIIRTRRAEFAVALIALLGVAIFGVMYGIAIAVATSIIEKLGRQYKPYDEVLLRDGKLASWASERLDTNHKHRSAPSGVVVYRFNGSIFFENSHYFVKRITSAVHSAKKPVTSIILDAGGINDIDFTAAEALKRLCTKFNADDIHFGLAHVSPDLNKLLRKYHLVDIIGSDNVYPSLQAAIFDAPTSRRSSLEMVQRLKIPSSGYVMIGGGVLEALGIRSTNDVDLVVTHALYKQFKRKGWREYTQDDGKRILSHNGYQIMETYVGKSLADLYTGSSLIDGVRCMSLDDLVTCKQKMGRKKDLEDIKLINKCRNTM